jgi:hypothetical protein
MENPTMEDEIIESLFATPERAVVPNQAEEYTKIAGDSDSPKNYDEI